MTVSRVKPCKCMQPAAACVCLLTLFCVVNASYAQDAGTLQREIEQNMPTIQREAPLLPKKEKPAVSEEREVPQILPSPIKAIDVQASRLKDETAALLQTRLFDKSSVTKDDLDKARTAIWELFRASGKLAHVELTLEPRAANEGGSRVHAVITEMRVRSIVVGQEGEGTVDQDTLDSIKREVERKFAEGPVFDLDDLDAQLKQRLFLGDVSVRALVEPVDADHINIKVLVGAKKPAPVSFLGQYDNTGSWSFGADRFTGGVSKPDLLTPGDKIDGILLKTMDIGGLEPRGLIYGRGSYEIPIPYLGLRLSAWGSRMHYHADTGVTSTTNAKGDAMEIGGGAHRPLYISNDLNVVGHAEFIEKWESDYLLTNVQTDNKSSHNGRVRTDVDYALTPTQIISSNYGVTIGNMDLSGNSQSLAQDQTGPRVNGVFAKYEGDVKWLGRWGDDRKIDTRIEAKGQHASKNLDSMEKLSLGGPNGLRAFGASEAAGDEGYIVNAEAGYQLFPWLRTAGFYDVGGVVRIKNPYAADTIPNSYVLQDVGVSFTSSYQSVDASLSFAHEVGHNPGLSSSGLDADNTKQRFRLFATLSYRY